MGDPVAQRVVIPPPRYEGRCLLVFDPHEDVAWLQRILHAERGAFSHLILGGDYFDSSQPEWGPEHARAMAVTLRELRQELGSRLTILLGNHDVSYLEVRHAVLHGLPVWPRHYHAAGFSPDRAAAIHAELDDTFWCTTQLVAMVHGYLISHAGVAGRFWRDDLAPAEAVSALEQHAALALAHVTDHYFPLLGCGGARGGREPIGGVTWLDFNFEFDDHEIPWPQVVGHTASSVGARQRGRSWCLDGNQTCYGVLDPSAGLEIKWLDQ